MSSIKIDKNGEKVTLTGILDENSVLTPLDGASGKVTIDFKGVNRVNSCGVREWINALKKMPATDVTYEQCPMVVVKQINAVPDFCGKAKIKSFYAPYYCENCDQDELRLISSADVKGGQPPAMTCSTCKGALVFDAIPGQYFGFLKRS